MSHRPNRLERDWNDALIVLDSLIDGTVRRRLGYEGEDRVANLARGFNELGKLALPDTGKPSDGLPDYSVRGMATAYAVTYLPHRISLVAGLLEYSSARLPRTIARVLDLGSGSDASRIGLELMGFCSGARFVTCEPSLEMVRFAQMIWKTWSTQGRAASTVPQRIVATLEDLCSNRLPPQHSNFDLILLSACLPYRYEQAERLGEQLLSRLRPGGIVAVIEPAAKRIEAEKLASSLSDLLGEQIATADCASLGAPMMKQVVLDGSTQSLKALMPELLAHVGLEDQGRALLQKVSRSGVVSRLPMTDFFFLAERPVFG